MKIRWLQRALVESAEAAAHIAVDGRVAAGRWREGLIDVAERIARYPQIGRAVPELDSPHMREVIYGNFRVIYHAITNSPVIVAVRHCRRRLKKRELREWAREAQEMN
jgi:toxin ParE1/3/4